MSEEKNRSESLQPDDPELRSLFGIQGHDEDEDDAAESEEELFQMMVTGHVLQPVVEGRYDRSTRIQQANHEFFSNPIIQRKKPVKVTFDLIPRPIYLDENGNVVETKTVSSTASHSSHSSQQSQTHQQHGQQQRRSSSATYRRRQTPLELPRRFMLLSQLRRPSQPPDRRSTLPRRGPLNDDDKLEQ